MLLAEAMYSCGEKSVILHNPKKDYLSKLKESLTQTDKPEIDLKDYKSTYNL